MVLPPFPIRQPASPAETSSLIALGTSEEAVLPPSLPPVALGLWWWWW